MTEPTTPSPSRAQALKIREKWDTRLWSVLNHVGAVEPYITRKEAQEWMADLDTLIAGLAAPETVRVDHILLECPFCLARYTTRWEFRMHMADEAKKLAALAGETPAAQEWRCFHCGMVCRTEADARNHFGPTREDVPQCKVEAHPTYRDVHRRLRLAEMKIEHPAAYGAGTLAAQAPEQVRVDHILLECPFCLARYTTRWEFRMHMADEAKKSPLPAREALAPNDGGLAETERRHSAACRADEAQRQREAEALQSGFELGRSAAREALIKPTPSIRPAEKYTDLKLIDELLCDLQMTMAGSPGWATVESYTSVTWTAMQRLREAYASGEMPVITLGIPKYFGILRGVPRLAREEGAIDGTY